MSQLFHVFECKSEKRSIFKINPLDNPALILAAATSLAVTVAAVYLPWAQRILSTAPLTAQEFLRAALYAAAVPVISALAMLVPKRKPKGQQVEVVEMPG
jgi:Ca2+-transporting ATPase